MTCKGVGKTGEGSSSTPFGILVFAAILEKDKERRRTFSVEATWVIQLTVRDPLRSTLSPNLALSS